MIDTEPSTLPLRLFARARRIRGTHHRVAIPEATLAAVRADVARHGSTAPTTAKLLRLRTLRGTPPPDARQRRKELARLLARRGRLSALVRGVRDPGRHGALRHAILRLDANIIALRRVLARVA